MIPKKLAGWILVIIIPFLVVGLITSWSRHNDLVRRFRDLEQEIKGLAKDNQTLEEMLSFVSLDAVKELEVRKKLNFVKPGEKLVVFISPSPVPSPTVEPSWLDKVKSFFRRD